GHPAAQERRAGLLLPRGGRSGVVRRLRRRCGGWFRFTQRRDVLDRLSFLNRLGLFHRLRLRGRVACFACRQGGRLRLRQGGGRGAQRRDGPVRCERDDDVVVRPGKGEHLGVGRSGKVDRRGGGPQEGPVPRVQEDEAAIAESREQRAVLRPRQARDVEGERGDGGGVVAARVA